MDAVAQRHVNKPIKVLLVEDSEDDALLAIRALYHGGFEVTSRRVQTASELKIALVQERWDAVISDFNLPGFSGMDALRIFRSTGFDIPFILISGAIGEDTAVDAMKAGASDYVMKNSLARLAPALERELNETQIRAAHRRSQEALAESERRFREMADSIRDVFFLREADSGRVLYVSPSYEEIWGRSCESLYANPGSWTEAIHPDDRASAYEMYMKETSARTLEHEYRIMRPDGSIRWIEARRFPVRDAAGKIIRVAGVAADITERKLGEDALRESDRRFSDMLGNVELVAIMLDREARLTYCNDYFLRITGWRQEEVIGQDWIEHFMPPELEGSREDFAALLANKPEARHRENEIFTRSGERRLIRWNHSLLRSAAGDVIGTASIGEDITEQKRAEIKIKRLNRVYAMLSGINALSVRVRDRDELFREACRIAVEAGAFRMAWIGVIDPQTLDGKVVAWHGGEQGYVDTIRLTARAGLPESERPACRALRQLQPVICNDIATDPLWASRRDEFLARGHESVAYFPLTATGRPQAVIALFAGESGVFDGEETRLLLGLIGNISFALDHLDKQERLRAAEEQFRGLVEQAIAGLLIVQGGRIVYANPRGAEILGQGAAEELIGADPLSWIVAADRDKAAEGMRQLLDGEARSVALEFGVLRRDGVAVQVGIHGSRATHEGQLALIGLMQDITEKKRAEEQIARYVAQIENAFMSTVQVVTTLGELRDPYTSGHQRRVAEIAVAIGAELGFDARRQEGLRVAGCLHDIGKIRIPAEILAKPGKLTALEFTLIKEHPQAGYEVLKGVEFPWPVAEVARQHHERMDGNGYPQGLKGEAILLEARILSVADTVEAMCSHRPYRAALGVDKALAEIERGRGTAYDADVADACLRLFREKHYELPA